MAREKQRACGSLRQLELPNSGDAYVDGFSAVNDPDRVR